MKQVIYAAMLTGAAFCMPEAAFAWGGGGSHVVPAGDSLAQTPPVDVTPQQLRAAPPQFRTREKIRQLRREPGVDPNLFQDGF